MRRWLACAGSPVLLTQVLYTSVHTLIGQSLHARLGVETTNGDGFGIGRYGAGPAPGTFRSVEPARNDQNLREPAGHVSSPLLFAYVRPATGSSVQQTSSVAGLLDRYRPEGEAEAADLRRIRVLAETVGDPWRRDLPLHLTASALIVHPGTARVLLRWHQRHHAWRQVGGHGDPGESDPLAIAAREASEETGLPDLEPWPDAAIRHVVIVDVPAGNGEPAHQHADIRYFMATQTPSAARAEHEDAPLRWLSLTAAREMTSEPNLRETLGRLERLLAP